MSHPLLQCSNVDSVLKMPCRVGVAEFVQKPACAIGTVGTAIDFDRSVVELVLYDAMTAIEFSAVSDRFEFFQHCAVRPPGGARK